MTPPTRRRFIIAIHWYLEAIHEGILRYCVERGHEAEKLTVDSIPKLSGRRFDGVIAGLPAFAHPIHRFVVSSGLPVVEMSHSYPEHADWCRCPSDSAVTGRLAADYLRRRPVKSFAYLTYHENTTGLIREAKFRDFLAAEHDRRPIYRHCYRKVDEHGEPEQRSRERLATFLRELPRPAGVFAAVDEIARIASDVAAETDLSIPGDLYLLGFGDKVLESKIAPVPISTISIDYAAWGYAAAGMLDAMIDGTLAPGTIRPFAPGGVISRASTGGEAGGDELCGRALALMKRHLSDPLAVPELAKRLGVSPSTLKRAFASSLGMGIAQRYTDLRIEAAKGLLAGGDKVEAVAAAVGFGSARALRKAFLKTTGVTPGSFSAGA